MGERPSVLIVDDDLGTCETLSDILEGSGFNAAAVKSGEECIETVNYLGVNSEASTSNLF